MARIRRPNPLRKPSYGQTAVNYVIDPGMGLFYCIAYDFPLAEQLNAKEESLLPALLGAVSVSVDPSYPEENCMVDYAAARRGYGPLVYDLTARGLGKYVRICQSLKPSDAQSQFAQSFWQRVETKELRPLSDDVFTAKYGVPASVMESKGKKWSRGRRLGAQNHDLVDAANRMFRKYISIGIQNAAPIPLSAALKKMGYRQ